MKSNSASERHQNNNLKAVCNFANFLGQNTNFEDIKSTNQILSFLDTKIKSQDEDPDKKWITTWNDYLHRIKHFLRWLNALFCNMFLSDNLGRFYPYQQLLFNAVSFTIGDS